MVKLYGKTDRRINNGAYVAIVYTVLVLGWADFCFRFRFLAEMLYIQKHVSFIRSIPIRNRQTLLMFVVVEGGYT